MFSKKRKELVSLSELTLIACTGVTNRKSDKRTREQIVSGMKTRGLLFRNDAFRDLSHYKNLKIVIDVKV